MGRPPGRPRLKPLPNSEEEKLHKRINILEEENVGLGKRIDRLQNRYQQLVKRTVELVLGDLKDD